MRNQRSSRLPGRKISETFLEFAQPLISLGGPDPSDDDLEGSLALASSIWNAVVFADVASDEQYLSRLHELLQGHSFGIGILEEMIGRKRRLFGDDQRLVGKYSLKKERGKLRLRVEAHAPPAPLFKGKSGPKNNTAGRAKPSKAKKPLKEVARCGLCGKTKNLMKTPCCGNWICDDQHKYVLFSYARNSCHRNHDRYTLCAYHFHEGHSGDWKDCAKCRGNHETEMYVWYGTNEFNFEKLPNPPAYQPTLCSGCGKVIKLGTEGHMISGDDYFCERCSAKQMRDVK